MNTQALARINNRYSNKGYDVNRVNLSRHDTKEARNTLQLIAFFVGVFDKHYIKREV